MPISHLKNYKLFPRQCTDDFFLLMTFKTPVCCIHETFTTKCGNIISKHTNAVLA